MTEWHQKFSDLLVQRALIGNQLASCARLMLGGIDVRDDLAALVKEHDAIDAAYMEHIMAGVRADREAK